MTIAPLKDDNHSTQASIEDEEAETVEYELEDESQAQEVDEDESYDNQDENETEDKSKIYPNLSIAELSKIAKTLLKIKDIPNMLRKFEELDTVVKVKELRAEEEAKKLYIQKLGTSADFKYRPTNELKNYHKIYNHYKNLKDQHQKIKDKRQKQALQKKDELLKQINDLIKLNFDYNKIKDLLKEWRAITDIPDSERPKQANMYREVIQNFKMLNQINLQFLRLDQDKNLEKKKDICKRAETLVNHENPYQAYKQFYELLEEFKATGHVPLKNRDEIWERLKLIRSKIRKKRDESIKKYKETLQANLKLKEKICERLKPFMNFDSKNLKDWYNATDQIKKIQKEWHAVGHIPKDSIDTMKQKYHDYLDGFYNNKQQFFKDVDEIKNKNFQLKLEIYNQIQAFKDAKDLNKSREKIIDLQKEWYKIGAIPDTKQDLTKNFKQTCDEFFNKVREYYKERQNILQAVLKSKHDIITNLDNLKLDKNNFEQRIEEEVNKFIENCDDIPTKSMKPLVKQFVDKIEQLADKCKLIISKKKQIALNSHVQIRACVPSLNMSLVRERSKLFKQISTLIYEAKVLENNLGFFQTTSAKKGFNKEIVKFKNKLDDIKKQLREKQEKLAIYKKYLEN